MANPIILGLPPRDPRKELETRLQNAPIQHAAALLSGYELLQVLHESGALDILRGLLGSKDKLVDQAADKANTPATIRMMRNSAVLIGALGEMNPEALQALATSWSQALTETREKACDPPGFWKILRQFHGEDLRRGLVLVNTLLEKFGKNLCSERSKSHE
jgi:uncharacterized protein YjgD (DUF1641 family)